MSSGPVPMTEEGMMRIRGDIETMLKRRPAIQKAIEEAREKGDLRENADYHAARDELAMLDARIAELNGLLATAVLVDPATVDTGRVTLGCTVTCRRVKDGEVLRRTLVGAGQADPASGKILAISPLAKGLIGAAVGDRIVAQLPGGPTEFVVLKIEVI